MERLPEGLAAAVALYLTGPLLADPARVGKPLRGDFTGCRSARVGLYRIIYQIDEDLHAVFVERIEHRADVYRKR